MVAAPQARHRVKLPSGRRQAEWQPRPAHLQSFTRFIPGADSAQGIGSLHIARSDRTGYRETLFQGLPPHQSSQETGDGRITGTGRTRHIVGLEGRLPQFSAGPICQGHGPRASHVGQSLGGTRAGIHALFTTLDDHDLCS